MIVEWVVTETKVRMVFEVDKEEAQDPSGKNFNVNMSGTQWVGIVWRMMKLIFLIEPFINSWQTASKLIGEINKLSFEQYGGSFDNHLRDGRQSNNSMKEDMRRMIGRV